MSTPTAAGLAAEIRAEMARQGVIAAQVAPAITMSRSSLSRKLNGTGEFTVAEAHRVSEFLGLPLSDLLVRAEAVAR